ncbi:hypothetical protein [Streptomyces sp. TLI_146]|uniref:hypothetical protein n=1 Tax=Streptomyces sp. TLI_146 TaxID=1938858 RepID=UPI000C7007F8|nr:hypothetical protein [Streptomyces sp. TLI_146]PKV88515.1 hypothetical protein BX283_6135 [Streptomyces sp. TLI_146]
MNGPKFIARVIEAGSLFGFSVGVKLVEAEKTITLDYIEEIQGRRGARMLRRDYGLFEATFGDESDWTCRSIILEIHRLASMPDLADKIRDQTGIDLASYTEWADVENELHHPSGCLPFDSSTVTQGDRIFRSQKTGVTVTVIDDPSSERGPYPGHGDIWGLDIIDPKFL